MGNANCEGRVGRSGGGSDDHPDVGPIPRACRRAGAGSLRHHDRYQLRYELAGPEQPVTREQWIQLLSWGTLMILALTGATWSLSKQIGDYRFEAMHAIALDDVRISGMEASIKQSADFRAEVIDQLKGSRDELKRLNETVVKMQIDIARRGGEAK